MVKLSKRFLSLFLVLMMCIGICPMTVFAVDYAFTVQPESKITISADTLTYSVDAKTNFSPTKVKIARGLSTLINFEFVDADITNNDGNISVTLPQDSLISGQFDDGLVYNYEYKIYAYRNDQDYICSDSFQISTDRCFTRQPESGMTGADGTYTVNWKLSFVADCIDVRRIDYYDASGEPCGWSEPPIVDNATSCTVTLPEDKDSADYIVIVFRKDDGGGLKKVCESTFTVERFRFTQQPGRYYDDETSTYIEDENIAPVYGEFAPFWKLSAEAYKQQLIYYPVSDPDNKTVVELDGDNEYPITSTNKWEDYEGFVRAWYGTGEDEYIDSMTFTIHMQGPGLRIELNGGSYGLTVKNGENGFDRTEYIQYEEGKNIVFPECMLTPPEGMMFDCWVLTDPKSYFMAMENVNTQTSEELPPDDNPSASSVVCVSLSDDLFNSFMTCHPGDVIDTSTGEIEINDVTYGLEEMILFPVWKERTYTWTGGELDKTYDGEPVTFYLDEIITPYIPADYFDFYLDEAWECVSKSAPDMAINLYEFTADDEMQIDSSVIREYNADVPGGARLKFIGTAAVGRYEIQFVYKEAIVCSKSFEITAPVTYEAVSVKLSKSDVVITKDGNETLTATVTPDNATDKTVTWTTSNSNVATVDENGKVTAIGAGTATITATTANGLTATCKVTVKVPLTNNTTIDKTNLAVGQSATVTGAATGGSGSQKYLYYYKKSGESKFTRFSTTANGIFKPAEAGTYIVRTYVNDSAGAAARKDFTVTVTAKLENNTSIDKTSIAVGESATLTGAATGGSGSYTYEFYYKKSTSKKFVRFGSTASEGFKPIAAGSYIIRTYAKDTAGNVAAKDFTITVTTGFANKTNINKTSAAVGSSVTVTGAAMGGSGTYTYEFYYKKSTSTKFVRFGSTASEEFKPIATGTYTIRTYAKDTTRNVAAKDFTITVTN